MTVDPGWVPPGTDVTKANVALDPNIRATMRANRAFLGRAVRFLAGQAGIRQFPEWRPDSPDDITEDPAKYWALVGVGRYDGPPKA
jgi:S-adenosyl methyltransferase